MTAVTVATVATVSFTERIIWFFFLKWSCEGNKQKSVYTQRNLSIFATFR